MDASPVKAQKSENLDHNKTAEYTDHATFPATAPQDYPHILRTEKKTGTVGCAKLKLPDAVATRLYKLEFMFSGTLSTFFDAKIKSAGFFTEYQPGDLIRWEDISQSTIEEDGRWNTTWGDLGTYSQSRLDAFICDGFFALWQDLEYCENSNKPEGPSDSEAKRIYQLRLWEETSGAVFKVEIKEKQDMGVGM